MARTHMCFVGKSTKKMDTYFEWGFFSFQLIMLLCSWGWSTSSFGFGLFDPFRPG
jgi:hypothetical protein